MSCNPCCCSLKDSAVTIGIWSVVYSVASLALFSWQTYVLNKCRAVVMAQANLQCEWDCPCVGASTARTTAIIEGLFIIQVLCLISVFFLLFAAVAMIWGVHTWSKYLIWPWFPCMVCSILSSLAYCIMWWAGDVRDYWLALTIIEIIGVFVNVYCVVVVLMYYRKIEWTTRQYEGKAVRGSRRGRRPYSSRRDLLELSDQFPPQPDPRSRSPYPSKTPYPPYGQQFQQPLHQPYPAPYSPAGVPQTPLPLPPSYTPYPVDPNEMVSYKREPKKAYDSPDEDPVKRWVKTQQKLDRGEANSEPISPTGREEVAKPFPLQQSRSVPSMFDGSLVSHKGCDHDKYHRRSSSRRKRSRSRHRDHRDRSYSSGSETKTDFDRERKRSSSRHRNRSKSRYSESEFTATTDHRDRHRDRERERRHRDEDRYRREEDGRRSKRHRSRKREDEEERDSRKRHRHREERDRREEKPAPPPPPVEPENPFPGFVVPQHIVIPPSSGERGPDGQPLPQKFQINSEITINYDRDQPSEPVQEPYRRRYPPMQITSNV